MSIVVEHEKRRYEILEKALDVFMDEGFEAATFQKIAGRCGITRTTLYIYFKNKKEIFSYSIKQFLSTLESSITEIRKTDDLSHSEKLIQVMTMIMEKLEENRHLLLVILNYLIAVAKGDHDPGDRVRRRTVRMRRIFTAMLIEGMKDGEFSTGLNLKDANEILYSFFEAAIFRMTVLRRPSAEELQGVIKLAVRSFAA
jgi:AcrR family transcriptional regulator